MIHRRVGSGLWRRIHKGVYAIGGTQSCLERAAMAACLAAGPCTYVTHFTAAALWQFERIRGDAIHIRSPRRARIDRVTWHRGFDLKDRTHIGPIPVTTPERTIIDLASLVPLHLLAIVVDDGLRRKIARLERLQRRLGEIADGRHHGVRALRRLVDERVGRPVSESTFETVLLPALRAARLPEPIPQHKIRDGSRVVARPDFAYPDLMIAIEADSRAHHSSPSDWERDLARRNRLTAMGWLVIQVTWWRLHNDLDAVVAEIARALLLRSKSSFDQTAGRISRSGAGRTRTAAFRPRA